MKKLLGILSLLTAMFVMAACSGGNTPGGVAEKAVKCMKDKDYKGYVDLVSITEKGEHSEAEMRSELTMLLSEKASKDIEKDGEIESYKILSEEISEDGAHAMVKMQIAYSKGNTDTEEIKLVKTDAGDWMLDMGK